jgi:oxygen-independent coproporphyrinogen-3 oxidase
MSNEKWKQNIRQALSFNYSAYFSYALTVEPKTALKKTNSDRKSSPNDEVAQERL